MKIKSCKRVLNNLIHNHKDAIRCSKPANGKMGYCKECYVEKIQYNKKYYKKNKESVLEKQAKYRAENVLKIKKKAKKYYKKNKATINEKKLARYHSNVENKIKTRMKKRQTKEIALANCKLILGQLGIININPLDLTDNRVRTILTERFNRNGVITTNEYAVRDLTNPRMIYEIDMCFHDINLLVEGKVSYLMQDEDTIMKQHARQLEKMKSEGLLKYLKYQYSVDGSVFGNNLLDLYKVLLFFYKKRQVKLINNNIMTKVQYSRVIKFLESDIKKLEKVKDLFIKNKYSRTLAIGKIHIIK